MDQLVTVLNAEKACELRFSAGKPPVVVLEDWEFPLQSPPLLAEEVTQLLRSIANSRRMRELQRRRKVQFVFTIQGRMPVLVRAQMDDGNITFDIS